MDENPLSVEPVDNTNVGQPIKKKIIPFSDIQESENIAKRRDDSLTTGKDLLNSNASTFVPTKIDINEELRLLRSFNQANSIPVTQCHVNPPINPTQSFESLSENIRQSLSEIRSFLHSELSTLSDRLTPSSSTPSPPHLSSLSPDVASQILQIVRDNNRMLTQLVQPAQPAQPEADHPANDPFSLLREEEKKTASLSSMLSTCITENDRLTATIDRLRLEVKHHASAEMEYTLLYTAAMEEALQSRGEATRLQSQREALQKQVEFLREQVRKHDETSEEALTLGQLKDQLNSFKFTNQLLMQQLSEERKRGREREEEGRKRIERLTKENEEMRHVLSLQDSDYEFIEDSSDE